MNTKSHVERSTSGLNARANKVKYLEDEKQEEEEEEKEFMDRVAFRTLSNFPTLLGLVEHARYSSCQFWVELADV